MALQTTITEPIEVSGVNVYTGRKNLARFLPSIKDTGIVFRLENREEIPAKLSLAGSELKSIYVSNGRKKVRLVEHLLSPIYALGIDNLVVELSDNVCPTTDNCAREYFNALKDKRRPIEGSKRKFWTYSGDPIDGSSVFSENFPDLIKVRKGKGFIIRDHVSYPHLAVEEQELTFEFSEQNYENEIMNARSIAFLGNEFFKNAIIALGKMGISPITEKNYLLVGSKNSKNYGNSFGFAPGYKGQEFVRHKILDVLGTLALTGRQFKDTRFDFLMTGHKFDLYALKTFFDNGLFKETR